MRRGEPDQKTQGTHGSTPNELRIPRTTFPPSVKAGGQTKPGNEGPAISQRDPTDSKYIQDVKGDAVLKGFISDIKPELKALDEKLKNIRTKTNGSVHAEMPLSANLVVNSTNSGKGKKPLSQQDVKKYEMVLTWGDDSDNGQKQCKRELQEILSMSWTEWKISIMPPVASSSTKKTAS